MTTGPRNPPAPVAATAPGRLDPLKHQFQQIWQVVAALVLIHLVLIALSEPFRSVDTLLSIFGQASILAILACGTTVVLISGGLDLSVGSIFAVVGVVVGILLAAYQLPVPLAVIIGLTAGTALGAIDGTIQVLTGVPAFIVTPGGLTACKGIAEILASGRDLSRFPDAFQALGSGYLVPMAIMFAAALLAGHFHRQHFLDRCGQGGCRQGRGNGGRVHRPDRLVAEVSDAKREILPDMGAEAVINPQTHDLATEIAALTQGHGADAVIEAVGLPETFRAAVDLAGFAGRVVHVGYAKSEVSHDTARFIHKVLDILGSRNGTRKDFQAVIAFPETGARIADRLISRVFSWPEADRAFAHWTAARNETFKVMIELKDN